MKLNEKELAENFVIDSLTKKGWAYIQANALNRDNYNESILEQNLRKAIIRINGDLTENDINSVINALYYEPLTENGADRVLEYIKNGVNIKLEKEGIRKEIKLIDFENLENNEYIISNQIELISINGKIIPDILLYVNGIPLVIIETKNPVKGNVTWEDGYEQILRYHTTFTNLFKYAQIGIAGDLECRYFPVGIGIKEPYSSEWKGKSIDQIENTIEMFEHNILLDLIKNYIYYKNHKGRKTKIMARYIQYRAINKVSNRIKDYINNKSNLSSGIIWHWQGSGKTLEIIFAAYKAFRDPDLKAPSIFIVVDRTDLETQIYNEIASISTTLGKPEKIASINELKKVLEYDQGNGKRGIFVLLIHKFNEKELDSIIKKDLPIRQRKNVILLIDEAHRTQYGTLAKCKDKIFLNACSFAFTGTPISKKDKDTFTRFGSPLTGEKYLDKYFIQDSINDNVTVPLIFRTVIKDEWKEEFEKIKPDLEFFINQELDEIPEEYQTEIKKKISPKLTRTNLILENEKFIEILAKDISNHFKKEVEPKEFKAMIVCPTREACRLMKIKIDKYLPNEYSEVIISGGQENKNKKLNDFINETEKRTGMKLKESNKKFAEEKFKTENIPKILIVTDMLITGFDAPKLQTMYLFKPIKEHKLLQAVARTNRTYTNDERKKANGLIIDYIGIIELYNQAIKKYNLFDTEEEGQTFGIDPIEFMEETISLINNLYEQLNPGKIERETLIKTIHKVKKTPELKKKVLNEVPLIKARFDAQYDDLKHNIEIKNKKEIIEAIYQMYKKYEGKSDENVDNLFREIYPKIKIIIEKNVKVKESNIVFNDVIVTSTEYNEKTNSERDFLNFMSKINKLKNDEREAKKRTVKELVEKIDVIISQWEEGKKNLNEAIKEFQKKFDDFNKIEEERIREGLDEETWNVMYVLKNYKIKRSKEMSKEIVLELKNKKLLFPGWHLKKSIENEVSKIIRLNYLFKNTEISEQLKNNEISLDQVNKIHEEIMDALKTI